MQTARKPATTTYTIQRLRYFGRERAWVDISETFEYLPAAKAALARLCEDVPTEDYRIATWPK